MRLIDADELKPDTKTFTSAYSEELTEFYSKDAIDNSPTVDAEPLRHREWTKRKVDPPIPNIPDHYYVCSECGKFGVIHDKYCRNCGAKMDGCNA